MEPRGLNVRALIGVAVAVVLIAISRYGFIGFSAAPGLFP
jgi:hypothetical protein